jgi:hypothetical protein
MSGFSSLKKRGDPHHAMNLLSQVPRVEVSNYLLLDAVHPLTQGFPQGGLHPGPILLLFQAEE